MIEQTPIRHKGSPPGLSAGGWLTAARACPSPNCDARPDEDDISLMVIHNISLPPGQFGGARWEEHTSELQSLMRHSVAVFCITKKIPKQHQSLNTTSQQYIPLHNN